MPTIKKKVNKLAKLWISRLTYAIDPQLIYGKEKFYTDTRKGKIKSIKVATSLIIEHFKPQDVIDIGCGEGLFLNELYKHGVSVVGCDISEAALAVSPKDFLIFQADATKPIRLNRKFDLCICIEIAEHIPTKYSKKLVKNLTHASDTIFFTAAPPGQGGVGHINEQPLKFWQKLFAEEGFTLQEELTSKLCSSLKSQKVIFWLYKNLVIFKKNQFT